MKNEKLKTKMKNEKWKTKNEKWKTENKKWKTKNKKTKKQAGAEMCQAQGKLRPAALWLIVCFTLINLHGLDLSIWFWCCDWFGLVGFVR